MKIFKYWWENPLIKQNIKGKPILKFTGEGCQSRDKFEWVGIVKGFEKNYNLKCINIIIGIVKYNSSYTDSRDGIEEIYSYPLVNADIQNVNGVWILFH